MDIPGKIPDSVIQQLEQEIRSTFPESSVSFDEQRVVDVAGELPCYYPQDMPEVLAYVLLGMLRPDFRVSDPLDVRVVKNRLGLSYLIQYLNINCQEYDEDNDVCINPDISDKPTQYCIDFKTEGVSQISPAQALAIAHWLEAMNKYLITDHTVERDNAIPAITYWYQVSESYLTENKKAK